MRAINRGVEGMSEYCGVYLQVRLVSVFFLLVPALAPCRP